MTPPLQSDLLKQMTFRNIGPSRGGRVVTVAGDPDNHEVFYFGACAGGVFKTTDAGTTWINVSDGFFKTASVGSICVAPSEPNVIYAGMGESTIRIDVSHGDGVYKSTDSGKTWRHCGLADTRHIGKVIVHPKNPDVVYVAALGHAFGPNEERGVFRSTNGGKSWDRVLFKSNVAGAVDIAFDAHPDVLYASIWQTYRNFWELSSGGPDSGLWMSRDGGSTWTDITKNKGLPGGKPDNIIGKIGVDASPAQPGRVWALIEAKEGAGMYRSDDYGDTWQLVSDNGDLRRRPFYYMHVHADPIDADTVYVSNLGLHKSTDGGKTWTEISTPHGDNHGLWIDPNDNRRMVQGNDGGACVSFDGGASFSTIFNQLTGQYYNITADNQFPYRVYATQQDNSSISVPSDTIGGAITWGDCYVAGTGESGYVAVKPDDPNIVIVGAVGSSPGGLGALQKYDHRTKQIQLINVWPEPYGNTDPVEFKYRFPWTFPILFSPHDPNTLYTCANVAFKSHDLGHSWEPISPDLTRNDPTKLKASGGPITPDTSGAEHYCSIFTFRESSLEPGVFWAGSDDGLVHVSRDGGKSWSKVTPKGLPEWSMIRTVEPSPHDKATCYLAATKYKLDDNTPYLFVTRDYGATWQLITNGIPADDFTRVIRADPNRAGVLYAGTETGLYVSTDDGANWMRWEGSLAVTPVYDLLVKDTDLVVGTHGRGFWILDDLTPLYQLLQNGDAPTLFKPRAAWRIVPDLFAPYGETEGRGYGLGIGTGAHFIAKKTETGHLKRTFLDCGEGAPRSVVVRYYLAEKPAADAAVKLEFLDAAGNVVRAFAPKPAGYDKLDDKAKSLNTGPWMSLDAGFNSFVWNLRYEGAEKVPGNKTAAETFEGPLATPGKYRVRLTVGESVNEAEFDVVNDLRVTVPQADLEAQRDLLLAMRDKVGAAHRGVNKLRDVREQVQAWGKRLKAGAPEVAEACDALCKKLDAVEDALILPGEQKDSYNLISKPRLNAAISTLTSVVASADSKPTKQCVELFAEMAAKVDAQLAALDAALKDDVPALNKAIAAAGAPAVTA